MKEPFVCCRNRTFLPEITILQYDLTIRLIFHFLTKLKLTMTEHLLPPGLDLSQLRCSGVGAIMS